MYVSTKRLVNLVNEKCFASLLLSNFPTTYMVGHETEVINLL